MSEHIGDVLRQLGLIGMAQSSVAKYAWGFGYMHPGYFCSALLASVLCKISGEKLRD